MSTYKITVFYDDEVGSQLIPPIIPPPPAFPTTPILDSFNRANEDPLVGGTNWGGPIFPGMDRMKIVSQAIQQSTVIAGQSGSSFWSANIFGPGTEAYISLSTVWQNANSDFWLWICGSNENTANASGYQLYIFNNGTIWTWRLFRYDNGVATKLGADLGTQALGNGDRVGIAVSAAGVIQAWYKALGSDWATFGTTRTDTNYTSGHIGVSKGFVDVTSVLDDFGGGTSQATTFLDDMVDIEMLFRRPDIW